MILSRLSKAIREQNWFAVMLEFIIVIAGVVIGFQITAWNSERQESARQALFMERLARDFAQLETDAAFTVNVYEDVSQATSRAIDFILSGEDFRDGYSETQFRADLNRMLQGTAPIGSSPTFREMQSGGLLRYIEDDDLRDTLIRFELDVQRTQEVWTIFVGMQMDFSQPVLGAIRLSDTIAPNPDDDVLSVGWIDLERLRSDPQILGSLSMIQRSHIYNRGWQQHIADISADISRRLGNPEPENIAAGGAPVDTNDTPPLESVEQTQ